MSVCLVFPVFELFNSFLACSCHNPPHVKHVLPSVRRSMSAPNALCLAALRCYRHR